MKPQRSDTERIREINWRLDAIEQMLARRAARSKRRIMAMERKFPWTLNRH